VNKYLKGFINAILELGIGFVGLLVSLSVMVMSFLYYPDVMTRVDEAMGANLSWGWNWSWNWLLASTPLVFLLITLGLSLFVFFFTIKLIGTFDIEKVIAKLRAEFSLKKKEAQDGQG